MPEADHWKQAFLVELGGDTGAPGRKTLSFSRMPTVLLTFAANRFTRQNAALFQKRFGLGAMDWRMLVMLMRHPGASAAFSAETIGIDKAAISRSLARLNARGLAKCRPQPSDPRRKDWFLTDPGRQLHDEILAVVLARLDHQLNGFSHEEIAEFTRLLAKFHDNLKRNTPDEDAGNR
ncbi:MAG: MarR family winged helix-turn-helix transcriptional regulator [Pseudomonadota bacterium]